MVFLEFVGGFIREGEIGVHFWRCLIEFTNCIMEDGGVDTTVIESRAKRQTFLIFQLLQFLTCKNMMYLKLNL